MKDVVSSMQVNSEQLWGLMFFERENDDSLKFDQAELTKHGLETSNNSPHY